MDQTVNLTGFPVFSIPLSVSPASTKNDPSTFPHRVDSAAQGAFSLRLPSLVEILLSEEDDRAKLFGLLPENSRTSQHKRICRAFMMFVGYLSRAVIIKVMEAVPLEKRIAVLELTASVLSQVTHSEDKVDFFKLSALLPDAKRDQTHLNEWIALLLQEESVEKRSDIVRRFESLPEHKRTTDNLQACIQGVLMKKICCL